MRYFLNFVSSLDFRCRDRDFLLDTCCIFPVVLSILFPSTVGGISTRISFLQEGMHYGRPNLVVVRHWMAMVMPRWSLAAEHRTQTSTKHVLAFLNDVRCDTFWTFPCVSTDGLTRSVSSFTNAVVLSFVDS